MPKIKQVFSNPGKHIVKPIVKPIETKIIRPLTDPITGSKARKEIAKAANAAAVTAHTANMALVHADQSFQETANNINEVVLDIKNDLVPELESAAKKFVEIAQDIDPVVEQTKDIIDQVHQISKVGEKIMKSEIAKHILIGAATTAGTILVSTAAQKGYRLANPIRNYFFPARPETNKTEYRKRFDILENIYPRFQLSINRMEDEDTLVHFKPLMFQLNVLRARVIHYFDNAAETFSPDQIGDVIYSMSNLVQLYKNINGCLDACGLDKFSTGKIKNIFSWLTNNQELLPPDKKMRAEHNLAEFLNDIMPRQEMQLQY